MLTEWCSEAWIQGCGHHGLWTWHRGWATVPGALLTRQHKGKESLPRPFVVRWFESLDIFIGTLVSFSFPQNKNRTVISAPVNRFIHVQEGWAVVKHGL